ncbi:MAG: multi-sensor hybrid histidine kinase [Bacteroidetes bacterium]|nr:MAG: multi-sensor hybrid histidine kinase [Bacteroidota bacterium]
MLHKFPLNNLMKLKYCLFFLLFAFSTSTSQSVEQIRAIDSLDQQLLNVDSTAKIELLSELIQRTKDISPELTAGYLQQQMKLADTFENVKIQAKSRLLLSELLYDKGLTDSAMRMLQQALHFRQLEHFEITASASTDADIGEKSLWQTISLKSAIIWRTVLITSVLMLFGGVILMLLFSHRLKEKYAENQDAYGSFQLEIDKQRQLLEATIQERTRELEDQLQQTRAKDVELKKTLKRLKDASYLKNAFLSNMSHEIRTPLNGIIGFSSLLETELAMMENKELYNYASGIQQSGDRLLNLINNIIEISRIQANEIEVELHPCDVALIVNNVCEPLQFTTNEKGLKFKTKLPDLPKVLADNAKLMRVLHIIIDNAVKYTETGFVTISALYDQQRNDVVIKVKDTGVGMDASYMNFLFEAFRQESTGYSRQYQGAGLGLPLAKKLLDLMHGRIEIKSERGIGTTVEIYLPAIQEVSEDSKPTLEVLPIANAPQLGTLDIFIVEDDRMNRMVLQKILSKAGTLTLAVDGNETMKIVGERFKKDHIFQIMLFDINLPPPWDGVKLMQQIRTDYPAYKFIPFIAQTAYAMAGDKERFLDAGFDDYIAKPINKNELMTKIENQLKLRSSQE